MIRRLSRKGNTRQDELRALVRVCLWDSDSTETAEAVARQRLLARGHRLVTHDQLAEGGVRVRDAVTGQVLYSGPLDEQYVAALDRLSAWHVDNVEYQITTTHVPAGLQRAVRAWVEMNLQEARAYAEGTPRR